MMKTYYVFTFVTNKYIVTLRFDYRKLKKIARFHVAQTQSSAVRECHKIGEELMKLSWALDTYQ